MIERYNELGEIIKEPKSRLSNDQKHRIHQTKDIFDSDCSLCETDMKKKVKTYWGDGV